MTRRIIIDTDGGVDDALALLYALASPEAQIEAITTVHGNVPLATATRNVFETLSVAGARDMTVAAGAAAPLAGAAITATHVHGEDGLGGWTHSRPVPAQRLHEAPAPRLIGRLARRLPGELTLVTLGPLTNVALASRQEPDGLRQLREIVVMGGAVTVPGNVTATAEYNIYADPLAAREVLRSGIPVVLVGLDVTMKVTLSRDAVSAARHSFLYCLCEQLFTFHRSRGRAEQFALHDPLAVGVALDRALVHTDTMKLDVTDSGETTRTAIGSQVHVALDVDAGRFLHRFSERVLTRAD
ncbi:MAG TPA: nucleoside hydrolase [Bryobacteraceae bacterium]|nr:nucleoside hydrolase [Bryobacteraceae bacterium]